MSFIYGERLIQGVTLDGMPIFCDDHYDWWNRGRDHDFDSEYDVMDMVDLDMVDLVVDFDCLQREKFAKLINSFRLRQNIRKNCLFSDSHGSRGRKCQRPGRKGERRKLALTQQRILS